MAEISGANPEFAGKIYEPGAAVEVSAAKIREFANATQHSLPIHFDKVAAAELGYADIVAPPTFLVTLAQQEEAKYINDPAARVDFSRVVHSEENFELKRAVIAGDVLIPQLEVVSVKSVGPHYMVSTKVTFTDQDSQEVASVGSSLVIRGEEA